MNPIEIELEIRALEMMTKDFSKPGDSIAPTTGSAVWALSIRQPWAWLILNAGKDIENRTWPTKFRGHVLIHAAKGMGLGEYADAEETLELLRLPIKLPMKHELQRGGIVGEMDIVDCVTQSDSDWFFGTYGFVLRNAKPLPFQPCRGALGFFNPQNSDYATGT